MARNISARKMSRFLGQNENYINHIENKKSFPTMQAFFNICEYLGVTPKEFFDERNACPERLREVIEDLKKLPPESLAHVAAIVRELAEKKPSR